MTAKARLPIGKTALKQHPDFQEHARWKFPEYALQYYITARFAHAAAFTPVAGNLYHHAVELMLKHRLLKKYSLADLASAKKGFGHDLPRLWESFKAEVADQSLSRFDDLITELQCFEDIRYPDELALTGGHLFLLIKRQHKSGPTKLPKGNVPHFNLALEDMDDLMIVLFEKCSVNLLAFEQFFRQHHSGKHLLRHNREFRAIWKNGR